MTEGQAGAAPYTKGLLSSAPFRRYLLADVFRYLANGLIWTVSAIVTLALTDSQVAVGFAAACLQIPALVGGPVAGVVVDRSDHVRLRRRANGACGATALLLAVLLACGWLPAGLVFVFSLAFGVCFLFDELTASAMLVPLVGTERAGAANGFARAVYSATGRCLAPLLAGLLGYLGGRYLGQGESLTLAVAGLCSLLVLPVLGSGSLRGSWSRVREPGRLIGELTAGLLGRLHRLLRVLGRGVGRLGRIGGGLLGATREETLEALGEQLGEQITERRRLLQKTGRDFAAEIGVGISAMRARPAVLRAASAHFAMNAGVMLELSVMVVYCQQRLGLPAWGYGVVMGLYGFGSLVGSLLAEFAMRRLGHWRVLWYGQLATVLLHVVLALSGAVWLSVAALMVSGVVGSCWIISARTQRQRLIEESLQGRVEAVYQLANQGGSVTGSALGGPVSQSFGLAAPFWVAAGLMTVLAPVLFCWPTGRHRAGARRGPVGRHRATGFLGATRTGGPAR
jgi:MFS family permease